MSYNKARDNLIKMYLDSLEENKIPWEQPWTNDVPRNAISNYMEAVCKERGETAWIY